MKKIFRFLGNLLLILFLTTLTQVGGIILIISQLIRAVAFPKQKSLLFKTSLFLLLYGLISSLVIPPIAKQFGRVPLPMFHQTVKPTNLAYCLLNRHYVKPTLKQVTIHVATSLQQRYPGTIVRYLDAGFPFFNKFPLLPHLSHHDGKKLDFSFQYNDPEGNPVDQTPSLTGYGAYTEPEKGEYHATQHCKSQGNWQYDINSFASLGTWHNCKASGKRTATLVNLFAQQPAIGKIFIEPHLKARWGLTSPKIRFHGCKAMRHDDHIHVQLR